LAARPLASSGTAAEALKPSSTSTRALLASVWREVLGIEAISDSEGFFEQGGDSLSLLEAVAAAHARGLLVPPTLIAEGWTIIELARWIDRPEPTADGTTPGPGEVAPPDALDCAFLRSDAVDDPNWKRFLEQSRSRPGRREDLGPPQVVLLTGGTGHLGSRLLGELLRRIDGDVVVLVRSVDPTRGRERVLAALGNHGIDLTPDQEARVQIVPGDLEQSRLGLTAEAWERLAERVDTIYHTAARVNLVLPYADLRPANVLGTREVVRLQGTGRTKRLHHASSLSVFVATDRNRGRLGEDDGLEASRWVHGGYAQTKWAAEWLVRASAQAAGPTTVYRLGLITGDSQTGRAASNDFLTLFIRGLTRLGCVPRLDPGDLWLDVTPIDFAAPALAHLSLVDSSAPPDLVTYHLANPRGLTLREILGGLRAQGVRLEEVSTDVWRERIGRSERLGPEESAACLALCRALPDGEAAFQAFRTMDLFQATQVVFDCKSARSGLAGSGVDWPPPGPVLLSRYLSTIRPQSIAGVSQDAPDKP
jgi:thioester reductase-like protein